MSPNSMEEPEPGFFSPIEIERDGEPRQEFDDDFAGDECEAKRLHQDDDHMNNIRSVPRPLANTFARSVAGDPHVKSFGKFHRRSATVVASPSCILSSSRSSAS